MRQSSTNQLGAHKRKKEGGLLYYSDSNQFARIVLNNSMWPNLGPFKRQHYAVMSFKLSSLHTLTQTVEHTGSWFCQRIAQEGVIAEQMSRVCRKSVTEDNLQSYSTSKIGSDHRVCGCAGLLLCLPLVHLVP